jgi:iron complex transport system ATP-binding protein
MTRIAADRLTVGYNGRPILQDLTLMVEAGELLGLIGPNGAGKTTALRALAGLLRPSAGAALLDGQAVGHLSSAARARGIGLVPQGETQAWALTVEEVVALGRAPHRGWFLPLSAGDRTAVEQALERTDLTALRGQAVDKLSAGERQRVLIARALAQEPHALLLDEPTANLDIHHQHQILDLVRDLVTTSQLAAIVAIHDLTLAARYCDRLVLLHNGQPHATGSPETVLTRDNLRAVFGVEAELYRDPHGQWALSVQSIRSHP